MDICTLVVATVVTTQACFAPQRCEEADGKEYCEAAQTPVPCTNPPAYFDCVTPAGEHYEAPWSEHPAVAAPD